MTASDSASTKRFLFLTIHMRRDCAKSVSESSNNFNRLKTWIISLWSVVGSMTPLLAHACKATTEFLQDRLQYLVQRSTTTGKLPHSTRTAVFNTLSYESNRNYDIKLKSLKKLANPRTPGEAGDSEHATVSTTGTMETTDKARTMKTYHRTLN